MHYPYLLYILKLTEAVDRRWLLPPLGVSDATTANRRTDWRSWSNVAFSAILIAPLEGSTVNRLAFSPAREYLIVPNPSDPVNESPSLASTVSIDSGWWDDSGILAKYSYFNIKIQIKIEIVLILLNIAFNNK